MNPTPPTTTQPAAVAPSRPHRRRPTDPTTIPPHRRERPNADKPQPATQRLTLLLHGITAGDYLTWVRDPEPHALGHYLKAVTATAQPLGRRIDLELTWDQPPPALRDAAITAGFPLIPEVIGLRPTGV
jgi:hypothetical protein